MPLYHYTVRQFKPIEHSGEIEALSTEAARASLEQQGYEIVSLTPVEAPSPVAHDGPSLSAAEVLELTNQMAGLSKAGLPLAAGLRAMEPELSRGRLSHAVQSLATQLEGGATFDAALAAATFRGPAYLQRVLAAGSRSNRLPEVLEQCLQQEQEEADGINRIWSIMAYPLVVVTMLILLMLFLIVVVTPPIANIFADFEVSLPAVTVLLINLNSGWGLLIVGLLGIGLVGILCWPILWRTRLGSWVANRIPLLGPIWRYSGLVRFCDFLAMLIDQSIPLPEALGLTAEVLPNQELAEGCRKLARSTAAGRSLPQAVKQYRCFPRTLVPMLNWGEQMSATGEALRSAAGLFRNRLQFQMSLFSIVIPSLMFLLVIASVVFIIGALMLPLVCLFSNLT